MANDVAIHHRPQSLRDAHSVRDSSRREWATAVEYYAVGHSDLHVRRQLPLGSSTNVHSRMGADDQVVVANNAIRTRVDGGVCGIRNHVVPDHTTARGRRVADV